MASSDRRWLLIGLAPCLLGAAPEPVTAPSALDARVAAAVAAAWQVPADAVRLEWHLPPGTGTLDPQAPFRLAGRGADGWFVVVLDGALETGGSVVSPANDAPRTLALRVRAGVEETLTVAARPLTAGTRLAAPDLGRERRVRWGPPAGADVTHPEPGWEVRRALAAGEVVAWPAAVPPLLVEGGQPVRLVWERSGVSIRMEGTALHSARRGERVRARVEGRQRPVVATVTAPGTAEITGDGR